MAEFGYLNGDLLVSAAWLAQHLHDPRVTLIDARSAHAYVAGHIPHAVTLEWTERERR
jgi:3-mercaptopyruvate sulfurtransferase SseA